MAETSIPTPSLSEAAQVETVAPSSLKGWSYFQREINVILPAALSRTDALLQAAGKAPAR